MFDECSREARTTLYIERTLLEGRLAFGVTPYKLRCSSTRILTVVRTDQLRCDLQLCRYSII
jgi:hypothetical protein